MDEAAHVTRESRWSSLHPVRDRDSFLNWMERAIRTRKEWPEFGWGASQVLGTRNPATLAHLATWDGGSALAIHNFADAPARQRSGFRRRRRRGAGGTSSGRATVTGRR